MLLPEIEALADTLEKGGRLAEVTTGLSAEDHAALLRVMRLRKAEQIGFNFGAGGGGGGRKTGEGSRGGHVIGHTTSGKPIYESADHPEHKGFTAADHDDAADVHHDLAGAAPRDGELEFHHKWHEEAHLKAARKARVSEAARAEHAESDARIAGERHTAEGIKHFAAAAKFPQGHPARAAHEAAAKAHTVASMAHKRLADDPGAPGSAGEAQDATTAAHAASQAAHAAQAKPAGPPPSGTEKPKDEIPDFRRKQVTYRHARIAEDHETAAKHYGQAAEWHGGVGGSPREKAAYEAAHKAHAAAAKAHRAVAASAAKTTSGADLDQKSWSVEVQHRKSTEAAEKGADTARRVQSQINQHHALSREHDEIAHSLGYAHPLSQGHREAADQHSRAARKLDESEGPPSSNARAESLRAGRLTADLVRHHSKGVHQHEELADRLKQHYPMIKAMNPDAPHEVIGRTEDGKVVYAPKNTLEKDSQAAPPKGSTSTAGTQSTAPAPAPKTPAAAPAPKTERTGTPMQQGQAEKKQGAAKKAADQDLDAGPEEGTEDHHKDRALAHLRAAQAHANAAGSAKRLQEASAQDHQKTVLAAQQASQDAMGEAPEQVRKSIQRNNLTIDLSAEDEIVAFLEGGAAVGGQSAGIREDGAHRLAGQRSFETRMAKAEFSGGTIYQGEFDGQGSRGGDAREEVARAQQYAETVAMDPSGNRGQGGLAEWFEDSWSEQPEVNAPLGAADATGWQKSQEPPIVILDDDDPYVRNQARGHVQEHQSSLRLLYQGGMREGRNHLK